MKKLLLTFMLFLVVGCSGPSNKDTCIPSRGPQDETALDGSPIANMGEIDQKLQDAHIISTIVQRIKEEVIGDSWSIGPISGIPTLPTIPGLTSAPGAKGLFQGLVASQMIQDGIWAAFTLYLIVFAIMILGGMINVTLNEVIMRMLKIGFIMYLALNWNGDLEAGEPGFYDLVGQTSLQFTDDMMGYFLNAFSLKLNAFGLNLSLNESVFVKLDYFIAKIFGMKMMAVISALLLAGGSSGPVYAILIVVSVFFVFKAILTVVLVYCFSIFARAMLFAVAPIFLACMLFKATQPLFDSWLRQLVNYSLQPVLVAAFLGVFLEIMQPFFQEFLKYQLCWQAVDSTREQYSWVFIDPTTKNKVDFGANSEPPIEIQRILLFLGFAYIFYSGTKLGQAVAAGLSGTVAGDLSAAAKGLGGIANYVGKKNSALGSMLKQL